MAKDWSETIEHSLLSILEEIESEDRHIRQRMLRECKQNELYWHGFQYIFWDERVGDFRIPTQDVMSEIASREETKYIYDYVVNIFKAHGLSIIAALSAEVPSVPFSPMDADNQADVIAAQKAETLGKIIHKYNKSKLIFYHALFTLFTNNFVVAYNYYERDEKFGTVQVPKYKKGKTSPDSVVCTNDMNQGGEQPCDFSSEDKLVSCPNCGSSLGFKEGEIGQVQDGFEIVNRGMEKLVIKGTLNWKLPTYAADQDACGYAIEYTDQHYAWIRKNYTNLNYDEIGPSATDSFERIARMPSVGRVYSDGYLNSLLTVKRIWLRPWMYDSLDKKESEELNKKYPKGCRFTVVDGGKPLIAEIEEEKLDDHITIAKGDLSRNVHGDPLGKSLIPMQDLENMLMNLNVESIEHSIPSTFASPEILDFETYSQQEVQPGLVYPFKTDIGRDRRAEDYFYTLKTSTLLSEAVQFGNIVENKGQFVVGAFPSIFGGPQTEGSKTLGEYQESRSYALQRLSIPYQLLFIWFADLTYKSVIDYISNMIDDEKYTMQGQQRGSYNSISLLMDEFNAGSFSKLLPESAVDLPESFSQKRSRIESILQLNSDTLNSFLFSPENRKSTLRFLGLEELSDLDSNQTLKQLMELDELLKNEPIENPNPKDESDLEISSVPVEVEIDDNEIHLRVLKTYLSGPIGQEHKKTNPKGYQNALLHGREHLLLIRESMMMQQPIKEQPKEKETEEVGV